jgi:hypothetical protein
MVHATHRTRDCSGTRRAREKDRMKRNATFYLSFSVAIMAFNRASMQLAVAKANEGVCVCVLLVITFQHVRLTCCIVFLQ